jgi:hypothetical protein
MGLLTGLTAVMLSGQRSLISSTQGFLFNRLTHKPAIPQKNWGDVDTTISTSATSVLNRVAESM